VVSPPSISCIGLPKTPPGRAMPLFTPTTRLCGCPGLGTNSLATAPVATFQPGISAFQVSRCYNRLGQGLLNPVRYPRQSQEFPRPLLHKKSPETLQQTPFLCRAHLGNALKISLCYSKELRELTHPISCSICSTLNFRCWHPSGKPAQAVASCTPYHLWLTPTK